MGIFLLQKLCLAYTKDTLNKIIIIIIIIIIIRYRLCLYGGNCKNCDNLITYKYCDYKIYNRVHIMIYFKC